MCRVCLLILILNSLSGCVYYGFDGTLTYVAANWNAMKRPAFIVERREHRPMHNSRVRFYRLLHNHPAAEGKLHLTSSHTPAHRWEETPPLNSPVPDEPLMSHPPLPPDDDPYSFEESKLVLPTPLMERQPQKPKVLLPENLPPEPIEPSPTEPAEPTPGEFPPAPETPRDANQADPFPNLISPGDEEPELQPKDRVAEAGANEVI